MNANRKANLWTTGLIAVIVVILLSFGSASCGALGIGNGWVAVDPASLPAETVAHALPTEVPVPDTDRNYVVVPEADVPEGVAGIDLGEVPSVEAPDWGGAVGAVGSMLGPWGAIGAALLAKLLATKRGRQNGAQAARALARLKPVEATKAILKADGWMHTEDAPQPKKDAIAS